MERGDRLGPEQPDRDVEQADRVAPAGEHRDERASSVQHPASRTALEHRVGLDRLHQAGGGAITNSAVGSGNPLRLTSPIGS